MFNLMNSLNLVSRPNRVSRRGSL